MPGNYEHSQHTLARLGREASDLHAWMDEPGATLGPDHRFLRHDPLEPPGWAIAEYGAALTRRIMECHIELDNYDFLEDLKRLEQRELARSERESLKGSVKATVKGVYKYGVLLDCEYHSFKEGDPLAYVFNEHIYSLGYVLALDRYLSVQCNESVGLNEGDKVDICKDETISHRFQLRVIERIRFGQRSLNDYAVIGKVFGRNLNQQNKSVKATDNLTLDRRHALDDSQVRVTELILGLEDGEILTVVGPPGTGKTEVIAKAAYELSLRGERVLITSHTNRAVDNAILKLPVEAALRLGRPEKLMKALIPYTISQKAKSSLGEKLEGIELRIEDIRLMLETIPRYSKLQQSGAHFDTMREELIELLMERSSLIREARKEELKQARVVGSTLLYISSPPYSAERFDVVLIDESSQVPLLLAMCGMFKASKWVLIGDHKQLLPIYRTLRDKELNSSLSAFCYFMNRYRKFSHWLEWHYRCNDGIIEFSKRHIYDNKISIHPSCKSITLESNATGYLNREEPAVFIDVTGVEEYEGGSRLNDSETDLIVKILGDLDESKIKPSEIGVISPYRAQCRAIKAKHGRSRVDVTTVDSFQGREKDVIIFSATSTRDLSFVEDANRINVAFTRARRKLIVVANERSVRGHASLLRKYIEYVGENNAYYSYNHGKIEKSTCPLRYVTNWERESIIFHSLKHEGL